MNALTGCRLIAFSLLIFFLAGCGKDEIADDFSSGGKVTDIDGNIYRTVLIDGDKWMADNLKTTRYNDGTEIYKPGGDNSAWDGNKTGAYSWYDNNQTKYRDRYGALYNWHAVNSGKLCPPGWKVPDDDEWTSMNLYLSGNTAGKLKGGNTQYWIEVRDEGLNTSGFNALPGGGRFASSGVGQKGVDGYFYYEGRSGRWWTSAESSSGTAIYRALHFDSENLYRGAGSKQTGFSVRCVKK